MILREKIKIVLYNIDMSKTQFKKRGSGVLMHISSLPGPFGIGTLGKNAYKFIDFLTHDDDLEKLLRPDELERQHGLIVDFIGGDSLIDPALLEIISRIQPDNEGLWSCPENRRGKVRLRH